MCLEYKLKINNTCHLEPYEIRPGDGSRYLDIDSVEIEQNTIKINIRPMEHIIIEINTPEIISILPSLLNGEITCYDAIQSLEHLLNKKYNLAPDNRVISFFTPGAQSEINKRQLLSVAMDLVPEDDFIRLCWFFPRQYEDRFKFLSDVRTKVVSDEIIAAIKQNFSFISHIETAYGRGAAMGALTSSERAKKVPEDCSGLIGTFFDRKDCSIMAQTCKDAYHTAREEYTRYISK